MKLSEKSQILLERYLLGVERHLPLQGRKDMIAEIQANLMDTLEDHYGTEEILTEDFLETELRKMGSPRSVAAAYLPGDNLIGSQHNTIFRIIVVYLTPVVTAVVFFAGLLSFALSGGKSPFWSIWELIGQVWQVGVGIIGTAAIVLMILTRFFPQVNQGKALEFLEEEKRNWKTSELPELVSERDKIKAWEPVLGIVFGSIALVFWIFLFERWAGMWWRVDEQWFMVPIFTDAFKAFIPWIAINTGLDLLVNCWLLYKMQYDVIARMLGIAIKVSEISLVSAMLKAGKLLAFDVNKAKAAGFPVDGIEGLQTLFQFDFVRWFLIFLLVVMSIDLIHSAFILLKGIYAKNVKP